MRKFLSIVFLFPLGVVAQTDSMDGMAGKMLDEIRICPDRLDSVWGSDSMNVADFVFYQDVLFLLIYTREQRWKRQNESRRTLLSGCRLVRVSSGNSVFMYDFGDQVMESIAGIYGEDIVLRSRNGYTRCSIEGNRTEFMEERDFQMMLAPVIHETADFTLLSGYREEIPYFNYYLHKRHTDRTELVCSIEDRFTKELFNSEYKYLSPRDKMLAYQFELDYGVDRKVVAAAMRSFDQSLYYEPLYAPAFYLDGRYYIFDHHSDQCIIRNPSGTEVKSVSLKHHKILRNWMRRVWLDEVEGLFYTAAEKSGRIHLYEIDLVSGETVPVMVLEHRYVERIFIHDGYAYYVYRPFESSQNRYLYRQRIFGAP